MLIRPLLLVPLGWPPSPKNRVESAAPISALIRGHERPRRRPCRGKLLHRSSVSQRRPDRFIDVNAFQRTRRQSLPSNQISYSKLETSRRSVIPPQTGVRASRFPLADEQRRRRGGSHSERMSRRGTRCSRRAVSVTESPRPSSPSSHRGTSSSGVIEKGPLGAGLSLAPAISAQSGAALATRRDRGSGRTGGSPRSQPSRVRGCTRPAPSTPRRCPGSRRAR